MSDIAVHGDPDSSDTPPPEKSDGARSTGVFIAFGQLPPATLITMDGLAAIMGVHRETVSRAIDKGDLPTPARLFGRSTWTVGAIVRHHERRMEQLADAESDAEKFRKRAAV